MVLLDAGPTILPSFPEPLRARAARDLRDMGVEIHVGTMVTGVDERGIETNSANPQLRRIEAATKIWAAGVQASPLGRLLAEAAGADVDRAGRVKVEPDCTLPGHPEVFVIGDLMSLDQLPGVAQVAIQSGRHAAQTILRRIAGDTARRPFRYRDLGTMATISRFRALAVIGRLRVSRLPRLDALARRPCRRADRVQEPPVGPLQLDGRVPRPRTLGARHHRAAGVRAARNRSTSGRGRFCAGTLKIEGGMTLPTVIRSITSTLVFGIMSMVLAAVFFSTVLRTRADYEAKTRQARYEPGRQLKDGSSSVPAASEQRDNGDLAVRSARLYEAGRQTGERTGNTTAPKK